MLNGLMLEIIRSAEALDGLQPYWDVLVAQMAVPTPFMRWVWVREWWSRFGSRRELCVGVIRDENGKPLAIAPWMVGTVNKLGRQWLRHLTWIGGVDEVAGERMDVIVPSGCEAELTPALLQSIGVVRREWDVVWLPAVPAESPNLPFLHEALRRDGVGAGEVERRPCRYTVIPKDWSAYEAARSSRWRRNLRNRWSALIDEHNGRRLLSGRDLPHGEALDHLARLHALQWPEGESNFLVHASWDFHRALALRLLDGGHALLVLLEADGRVVAAAYGLIERGHFSLYQQGWDPDFKELSIGNLVVHWSLEAAAERGLQVYDMLSGDSRYKAEWCPELKETVDIETFRPWRVRAQAFRLAREASRRWRAAAVQKGTAAVARP